MSSPDDDILAKIAAGLATALAAIGTWAWHHTHKRIDMAADKEAFDKLSERVENNTITRAEFNEHAKSDERQLNAINGEMSTQRDHIGKIFDQMRDMESTGHERHIELLNAINGRK
jgi:predicted transcriptional regulator